MSSNTQNYYNSIFYEVWLILYFQQFIRIQKDLESS